MNYKEFISTAYPPDKKQYDGNLTKRKVENMTRFAEL